MENVILSFPKKNCKEVLVNGEEYILVDTGMCAEIMMNAIIKWTGATFLKKEPVPERLADTRYQHDDDLLAMVREGYNTTGKITLHVMGIDDAKRCDLDHDTFAQYKRIQAKVTRRLTLMKKRKELYTVLENGRYTWKITNKDGDVKDGEQE